MRDHQVQFDASGIQIFAVTFESRSRVRTYRDREPAAFPVLRDPRREAYAAFGFDRRPIRSVWSPRTFWYYLRQALRGRLPHLTRSDYFQLGGDVLLSPDGEVCWVYTSREPADRPTIERILRSAYDCVGD